MASKQQVLDRLLEGISPREWRELEETPCPLPVNEFNRATLLRLRELYDQDGEVDADRVELMRSRLQAYLREQLPDKPDAHRFIIASCIGLAFVLCEPMHPIEPTGIRLRVRDGAQAFYCPIRENQEGSLCEFCACRDFSEWEEPAQRAVEA